MDSLYALSPLGGRYASRFDPLRPLLSEAGFMHRRVQVEVAWLIGLSDLGMAELPPFFQAARRALQGWVNAFSLEDSARIKAIEAVTNHDVKAMEYLLKEKATASGSEELVKASEFIYSCCTSEDINNTSRALMLREAREQVLRPAIQALIDKLALPWHSPLVSSSASIRLFS